MIGPYGFGCHIPVPCLALSNGSAPCILEFSLVIRETLGAKHFIKQLENYGFVEMLCPSPDGVVPRILEFGLAWRAKHSMTGIPSKD
jgi:hypothetical protein